jgi:hypothetical protein
MADSTEKNPRVGWEGCAALVCLLVSFPVLACGNRYMLYVWSESKARVLFALYVVLLGFWIGFTFSGMRRPGAVNRICTRISLPLVILFLVYLFLEAFLFL